MLKNKIREVPGLQYVVDSLELMSSAGRRRMLEQPWMTCPSDLDREQQAVSLMREALGSPSLVRPVNQLRHVLMQLHDLHTTLSGLGNHALLDEVELFEVKNLAYLCGSGRQALTELNLHRTFALPDLRQVFDLLDPDGTGVPNFYIYDSYDPRLTPLRNQMQRATDEEKAELLAQQDAVQHEVIVRLCDCLYPYSTPLTQALEGLAYIDFTMARAVLATEWQLCVPTIADSLSSTFVGLFNPRLKKHNQEAGLRYQPVDVALTPGVTLITGANMAGKTVLLKSVGLAQSMYQLGFPVPARECCISPVDDVVFCIGDEQDEMNGLSSFAAEITRISQVLYRSQEERLLVLIDEPARTTNPVEGKALVQALASLLQERGSLSLITTHYSQLGLPCRRLRVKGFTEDLANVPLTPQNINRFIDYQLIPDDSDQVPHEALRIAEMLSCYPDLITVAHRLIEGA